MLSNNSSWNYPQLLSTLSAKGYNFVFFDQLSQPTGQIALRHDIDFDTTFAVQMARDEAAAGIYSTYFFLLRSTFYNPYAEPDYSNIQEIKKLGHTISIHFDPTIYTDFTEGLRNEVVMFKALFDTDVKLISIHRPNEFFQNYDSPILGIEHTYQSKYFRDIKYFADSTGAWRFGHPCDSQEFADMKTLHLLTHSIWWYIPGEKNTDKLRAYYYQKMRQVNEFFSANCIPFRGIADALMLQAEQHEAATASVH